MNIENQMCNCIGPQGGQPLCPCMMRGVNVVDGRYIKTTDLGPVTPAPAPSVATTPTRGCVCPPGAEKTCQGALCPRQPVRLT